VSYTIRVYPIYLIHSPLLGEPRTAHRAVSEVNRQSVGHASIYAPGARGILARRVKYKPRSFVAVRRDIYSPAMYRRGQRDPINSLHDRPPSTTPLRYSSTLFPTRMTAIWAPYAVAAALQPPVYGLLLKNTVRPTFHTRKTLSNKNPVLPFALCVTGPDEIVTVTGARGVTEVTVNVCLSPRRV